MARTAMVVVVNRTTMKSRVAVAAGVAVAAAVAGLTISGLVLEHRPGSSGV